MDPIAQPDSYLPHDLPEDLHQSYRPGSRSVIAEGEDASSYLKAAGGVLDGLSVIPIASLAGETGFTSGIAEPGVERPSTPAAYELIRPIGMGGMGEVWEATQLSLDRVVAVKMVRRDRMNEVIDAPQLRDLRLRAFRHEALVSARLEHPNILPVHDFGVEPGGSPLLAMKRIHGRSWREIMQEDFATLDEADYFARHLPILISVAQGIAFAHSQGIVHRDLKPSQVMVGSFGEVLLADWGLAIEFVPNRNASREPRRPGDALPNRRTALSPAGTPAYMAPEQTARTAENVGPWTDVYLLAGTLYYLLTGTPPHQAPNSAASYELARRGVVMAPRDRTPGRRNPPELEAIAMRGLSPEIGQRIGSATEFVDLVRDYLTGASKRRQSVELAQQAATELARRREEGAAGDYRPFMRCLESAGRALELWDANGEAQALRRRAIEAYAEAALANGDLVLAQAQAQLLEPGPAREGLQRRAAEARDAMRRQARNVRVATVAAVSLVFVLFITATAFSIEFRRQRDAEQALRAQAEAAGLLAVERARGSQKLVNFMIYDLGEALEPEVDRDARLIAKVADRVIQHYAELEAPRDSAQAQIEHARALMQVSAALGRLARYQAAADLALQSLGILGDHAGKDSLEYAMAQNEYATLLFLAGRNDEAAAIQETSRAIVMRKTDPNARERWLVLMAQGKTLREQSHWAKAEEVYRTALSIAEANRSTAPVDEGVTLNDLGLLLHYQGRRDDAAPMIQRSLEIAEQTEPDSERFAIRVIEAAMVAKDRGQFAEARTGLDRGIALLRSKLGPDHPDLVRAYSGIAELAYLQRDWETAIEYYSKCVDIRERFFGRDYYFLAPLLQSLGSIEVMRGKPLDAKPLLERALELQDRQHGPDSVYHTELLMALAAVRDAEDRSEEAEAILRRVMVILDNHYKPGHPNFGLVRANLATLLSRNGRHAEADPLARESLRMLKPIYGGKHPFLVEALRSACANLEFMADKTTDTLVVQRASQGIVDLIAEHPDISLNPDARSIRALALGRLGRIEEAFAELDAAEGATPTVYAIRRRLLEELRDGNPDRP